MLMIEAGLIYVKGVDFGAVCANKGRNVKEPSG
jgi:hypothetical protein